MQNHNLTAATAVWPERLDKDTCCDSVKLQMMSACTDSADGAFVMQNKAHLPRCVSFFMFFILKFFQFHDHSFSFFALLSLSPHVCEQKLLRASPALL